MAWRDGLFLALAGAGFTAALHVAGASSEPALRPFGAGIDRAVLPALVVRLSLPVVLGLAALAGPLLVRSRWQASVLALGIGWISVVVLAFLQERTFGQSFDILPCAIGLAALAAVAILLRSDGRRIDDPASGQRDTANRAGVSAPA